MMAALLFRAAENDDAYEALRALQCGRANVDARDCENRTPLYVASREGHVRVARLLIEFGANVDAAEDGGATPLYIASQNGHADMTKLLLCCDAEIDAETRRGVTPLFIACQNGHIQVARLLLERGADVNAKNSKGATALHVASWTGHFNVATLLVKHGANVSEYDNTKHDEQLRSSGMHKCHMLSFRARRHLILQKSDVMQISPDFSNRSFPPS
eukprot:m.240784 g.240784  ORF g.240784 m.240784 type:complete len:215 (-) comp17130_c0_seq15:6252-6896(-)